MDLTLVKYNHTFLSSVSKIFGFDNTWIIHSKYFLILNSIKTELRFTADLHWHEGYKRGQQDRPRLGYTESFQSHAELVQRRSGLWGPAGRKTLKTANNSLRNTSSYKLVFHFDFRECRSRKSPQRKHTASFIPQSGLKGRWLMCRLAMKQSNEWRINGIY